MKKNNKVELKKNITKDELLRIQACPMVASVNWDVRNDKDRDSIKWFSVFNKLPIDIRFGLADKKVIDRIISIAQKHGLFDEFRVGEISRMTREFFFERRSKEEIKKRISVKLQLGEKTDVFFHDFQEIIKFVKKIGRSKFDEITENIPIIPALKKYSELKEQKVSKRNLKVRETGDYVMSTVGNWIDDYIQRKGAQAHSNLERSDYVFNSVNGERLSDEERKKLVVILESYDNDTNLKICKKDGIENPIIIFDQVCGEKKQTDRGSEGLFSSGEIQSSKAVVVDATNQKSKTLQNINEQSFPSEVSLEQETAKFLQKKDENPKTTQKQQLVKGSPLSASDNKIDDETRKEIPQQSEKNKKNDSPFEKWRYRNLQTMKMRKDIANKSVLLEKEKPEKQRWQVSKEMSSHVPQKTQQFHKNKIVTNAKIKQFFNSNQASQQDSSTQEERKSVLTQNETQTAVVDQKIGIEQKNTIDPKGWF